MTPSEQRIVQELVTEMDGPPRLTTVRIDAKLAAVRALLTTQPKPRPREPMTEEAIRVLGALATRWEEDRSRSVIPRRDHPAELRRIVELLVCPAPAHTGAPEGACRACEDAEGLNYANKPRRNPHTCGKESSR